MLNIIITVALVVIVGTLINQYTSGMLKRALIIILIVVGVIFTVKECSNSQLVGNEYSLSGEQRYQIKIEDHNLIQTRISGNDLLKYKKKGKNLIIDQNDVYNSYIDSVVDVRFVLSDRNKKLTMMIRYDDGSEKEMGVYKIID
ncbi:hypothetical protein HCJ66_13170 [Listeria sp. FSL L7-1582]|uniref:hypothetical protein n=1 Tax=Listeria portnoyi TaxID=2713504 RepID=UPI00164D53EE|nr:hypothetical protein [Listeria portnoyi]MBC6310485.1 hypothetical protein [Listeria portnoyi]